MLLPLLRRLQLVPVTAAAAAANAVGSVKWQQMMAMACRQTSGKDQIATIYYALRRCCHHMALALEKWSCWMHQQCQQASLACQQQQQQRHRPHRLLAISCTSCSCWVATASSSHTPPVREAEVHSCQLMQCMHTHSAVLFPLFASCFSHSACGSLIRQASACRHVQSANLVELYRP